MKQCLTFGKAINGGGRVNWFCEGCENYVTDDDVAQYHRVKRTTARRHFWIDGGGEPVVCGPVRLWRVADS